MGQQVLPGYSHYDKSDFNHGNHGRCITLQPFGTPLFPFYIKFEHNFTSNQHYIYGLCDNAKPPTTPYGWPLEAVPFIGPSLSPYTVNNDAMGIYNSQYLNACKVDIVLCSTWHSMQAGMLTFVKGDEQSRAYRVEHHRL
jgi:hypothetical protein